MKKQSLILASVVWWVFSFKGGFTIFTSSYFSIEKGIRNTLNIYAIYHNTDTALCGLKCLQEQQCTSFNLNQKTRVCELSSVTAITVQELLSQPKNSTDWRFGYSSTQTSVSNPTTWNYTINMKTASDETAGTDGDVYIMLIGDRGNSTKEYLDNPGNDRETDNMDTYLLTTNSTLGNIIKIWIKFEKLAENDAWKLDYVTVNHKGTEWLFNCSCWFDDEYAGQPARNGSMTERNIDVTPQ